MSSYAQSIFICTLLLSNKINKLQHLKMTFKMFESFLYRTNFFFDHGSHKNLYYKKLKILILNLSHVNIISSTNKFNLDINNMAHI